MGKFGIIAFVTSIGMTSPTLAVETVKPQDFAAHIKDGKICGPLLLSDKTGHIMINLGDKSDCLVLQRIVGFNLYPQTPNPNIKD
jgi:hypothetical protein